MSSSSTLVTEEHFAYLAARTRGEDEVLRSLREAAVAAGIPAIWIAPEQGSLLQILLRLAGARRVVEVGTLAGYSALWMARALPEDGSLLTIEVDAVRAQFAREWLERAGVGGRVEVRAADARTVLPELADDSVDVLFLDADKAGYGDYLAEGLRFVRPGGMILADNAFAFGELFSTEPSDRETAPIRRFNDRIAAEPRLQACIVPIGDGMWVAVKLR